MRLTPSFKTAKNKRLVSGGLEIYSFFIATVHCTIRSRAGMHMGGKHA